MDNGPLSDDKRECTDIICCLVFLAFLVGMVGVSGYGLVYGDPKLFLTLWDADKRACGYNTTADYPYLYYPIIDIESLKKMGKVNDVSDVQKAARELLAYGTCVKECPGVKGPVQCSPCTYMSEPKSGFNNDCVYSYRLEKDFGG